LFTNELTVETVEPGNDRSLEPWTNCPVRNLVSRQVHCLWTVYQNFEKHVKEFYASPAFKEKSKDAQPFFKAIKDFVFGRPTTLENAVCFCYYVSFPEVDSCDDFPVERTLRRQYCLI